MKECPAKNQDMYGNDIHQEVVSSWDECGEFLAKSNFLETECKLYVELIHGQFTSPFFE